MKKLLSIMNNQKQRIIFAVAAILCGSITNTGTIFATEPMQNTDPLSGKSIAAVLAATTGLGVAAGLYLNAHEKNRVIRNWQSAIHDSFQGPITRQNALQKYTQLTSAINHIEDTKRYHKEYRPHDAIWGGCVGLGLGSLGVATTIVVVGIKNFFMMAFKDALMKQQGIHKI